MSIQPIGSTSAQPYAAQSSGGSNFRQDFQGLETALLNGDVSGAQSALSSLQQTISAAPGSSNPNSIMSQLGNSNSQLGQDLQSVSSALSSNDVQGAQKAFAKLQQDLESARQSAGAQGHHGHHGHHAHASTDTDNGASATTALATLLQSATNGSTDGSNPTDLLGALQSIAASNPSIAKDVATLITDLNNNGNLVNTKA